ncbi:DNA sulfur modification protein DndB [Crocosphaera sp. UHCC 0190]|uniref:DNA sulfur modification protein DndB n=1 Tax=Crocosphaera sp. UHCC 0190 TaxID=3110246 RepID=UPI002B2205B2|nr:DNA sulfur modification protein DndB [Crocosphaera sp. UHCC 0190]MEA5512057.1 DNA sulfur modification protein DndB [Crocosphaera sp. UHCC 0190]
MAVLNYNITVLDLHFVMVGFEYVLPVIRGIQGKREYYVSMCPLGILPKLFPLAENSLTLPTLSQRRINKGRIKKIARYILENPQDYVFSAITASIDADTTFEALGEVAEFRKIGRLRIPMEGRLTIHDGLHRRVALEVAMGESPGLRYETIPLILYIDTGLRRSQQMFIDLNRWGIQLPATLTLLYDSRDPIALMVQTVVKDVAFFNSYTYLEGDRIPKTSDKLFTLYHLYQATVELLRDIPITNKEEKLVFALSYWQQVGQYLAVGEYDKPMDKLLFALGEIGRFLLTHYPHNWQDKLQELNLSDITEDGIEGLLREWETVITQ